jgi:formate C-acetyltransferase
MIEHIRDCAYQPSPRVQRLRDFAITQQAERYWGYWLHLYYYLQGWMQAEGQPLAMRTTAAYAHVIREMPVKLRPDDLLAGEHGFDTMQALCLFWGIPHDYAAQIAASNLTREQQTALTGWLDADPLRWRPLASFADYPPAMQRALEHGVIVVWGGDLNHSIRDYAKVLRLGFSGIRAEVQAALNALPLTDPDAAVRRTNLQAWLTYCDAAVTLGAHHAARARALAASDTANADEWHTLAAVCDRVPAEPSRTFREAVQALYFAHMLTVWEDGVNANGIGRLDQFLWPYLEADLAAGRITREEAADLLAALWCKLYHDYDAQQMMIGGQTADGRDAANPLSYLVLDVTEGLGFIRNLSARLHRGTPRPLLVRCVELVARGGGIPFFFNDEALIPALTDKGIPLIDARGYAAIGCIEITIPGKAMPHAVSNWVNTTKCLELALNNGCSLLDGTRLGPATGSLRDFADMDAVRQAYTTQLTYFTEMAVYGSNAIEQLHRLQYRLPYLSLLTDDCIARGYDIVEGGARYNYHSSAAMGLPNTADCLAALDQVVFTEQRATGVEVLAALKGNFTDAPELHAALLQAPKYGNDLLLPDQYAAELTRQFCELIARYRTPSGGTFFAHLFTFTLMIPYGKHVGATPDGRLAGMPLAYSVSPVQGRDREGLTAMLMSLSRLPHHLAAASSSAIVEVDPTLFAGSGLDAFVDLLATAIDLGIGQLQFNVVHAETLRAAQRDPERYANLSVRVSGFSQRFALLDREMQDHIIARTKHNR